ncbi:ABC transporter ATP-binding protein [Virgibacillus sp. DJP39]|uniref:ABC transporter ATP-binding protein n=1 Tax=Virgibacillus sp. DJP39 TaxID=3409790 RepID=UPI003BB4C205
MEEKIIQITGLTHFYNKTKDQPVLQDIEWEIKKGEFVSIQGRSGSGKSTILHIIGGLLTPSEGYINVDGMRINGLKEKKLALFRLKSIGFVFQSYHLFQNMTALKNVEEPLFYSGVKRKYRKEIAQEMLSKVGLEDKINSPVQELSGGQQQRVSIARALINDPDIILADEPTGNLDGLTEQEIIDLFVYMNKSLNKTLIVVTHNDSVADCASVKMKLHEGKLVERKTGGGIVKEYTESNKISMEP